MRRQCSVEGCLDPVWPKAKLRHRVCRFHDAAAAMDELEKVRFRADSPEDRARVTLLHGVIETWIDSERARPKDGES